MYVNYIPIVTCVTSRQATSAILVRSPPPLSASSSHSKCPRRATLGLPAPKVPNSCLQPPPVPLPSTRDVGRFFVINHPTRLATSPLWRFQMRGMGRPFRLWGGRFDCRVCALTLGWTFRPWGRRFNCGTDVSTAGCVDGHWGGRFECGVCISAGNRHIMMLGIALFRPANESSL